MIKLPQNVQEILIELISRWQLDERKARDLTILAVCILNEGSKMNPLHLKLLNMQTDQHLKESRK